MSITIRNQIAIDSSANATLNGVTVNGTTTFNGVLTTDTNIVPPDRTFNSHELRNANYNKIEISTGHPIIKYVGSYVGQNNSTGLIDIPLEAEDGDYILLYFFVPGITAIRTVNSMLIQTLQSFNSSNGFGNTAFVYQHDMRHILVEGNSTQSIYFLLVLKNSANQTNTSSITTGSTGMPNPIASPISAFQALEIYFAIIDTTGITPSAPTEVTMPLWVSHSGRTAIIAHRNNVINQTFDPSAFGSTPSVNGVEWRVISFTVPGLTNYSDIFSQTPDIFPIFNRPYILDITYYSGTLGWSDSIIWPGNIAPTITIPGSRHLVFLHRSNGKWLGIHDPL